MLVILAPPTFLKGSCPQMTAFVKVLRKLKILDRGQRSLALANASPFSYRKNHAHHEMAHPLHCA